MSRTTARVYSDGNCRPSIQSQVSKTSNIQLKEIKENTVVLTNIVQELESHASNTTFNQILNDECQKLKKENSVKWRDIMNRRKKSYWHCLQNFKKADLYSNWVQESPSYLPLKYRVKVNSSDSETATQHKIEAAKSRYRGDIELMYQYSSEHEENANNADECAHTLIHDMTKSETHRTILRNYWEEEVVMNENISTQIWEKRHNFLVSRKNDEEQEKGHLFLADNQLKKVERRKRKNRVMKV